MQKLRELESRSIFLLREAYAHFQDLGMLWSIGKDSTVLLWLARKAFLGHVPFPLIHIDTTFKIPEMISFRDNLVKEWGLELLVSKNESALSQKNTFPDGKLDRVNCCHTLKTTALKSAVEANGNRYRLNRENGNLEKDESGRKFTALIVGIRADEEGTRAKERYFSPRSAENQWLVGESGAEFWDYYNTDLPPGAHLRIHPLLDWREIDVWQYIEAEKIPVVPLYYANQENRRYRSLGCYPCTLPISSPALSPAEIISELDHGALSQVPERAGRAQDTEDRGGLERLRREGYL